MGSNAKTWGSCSLGDSESGYQAPPCYKLQTFLFFNFPNSKTNQPVKMAMSKIRQNYHEDCDALTNKQINMEFYASYVYLSMSSFFNRVDQALHGFADHFKKESNEERAHGMKLMEYLTEQVEGIKAVGDLITKMKRAGDGLGLHIIDKEMGSYFQKHATQNLNWQQ